MSTERSVGAGGSLARVAQGRSRARLERAAADLLIPPDERLTEQHRAHTLHILNDVFDSVEAALRQLLAVSIAAAGPAGRAAAVELGHEPDGAVWSRVAPAVMAPPFELLDTAMVRAAEHAIAAPRRASAPADGVFARLLAVHPDSELSQRVMDSIVAESTRLDGFGEPRLPLDTFTEDDAAEIAWLAGAALRVLILERHPLEEAALDIAIEQAVRQFLAERSERSPVRAAARLSNRLSALDALNGDLLASIAEEGYLLVLAAGLAHLGAFAPVSALRLICLGSDAERLTLLRALDLPADSALRILNVLASETDLPWPVSARSTEDVSVAEARRWLAGLRRDIRYARAIEALDR